VTGLGLRLATRGGRARIAPGIVGVITGHAVAFGLQRAGVGGVTLQCVTAGGRPAERLGEHRVRLFVGRGVLGLVAVALQAREGTVDAVGPAERATRRRIDGWTGHRARFEALAPRLVQIGHPFITLYWSAHPKRGVRRTSFCKSPYRRLRRYRGVPSANWG